MRRFINWIKKLFKRPKDPIVAIKESGYYRVRLPGGMSYYEENEEETKT